MSDADEGIEKRRLAGRQPGESAWTGRSFLTIEWNSTDLWNLDLVLADIIADGLNEFRQSTRQSGPRGMTEEAWDDVLGEMIDGFKSARELLADRALNPECEDRLDKALELFKKHFRDLSW